MMYVRISCFYKNFMNSKFSHLDSFVSFYSWVNLILNEFLKWILYPYLIPLNLWYAAPVVSGERLKRYIFHKICSEWPEGPFCIAYMHSTVQKEDNSPGITILRWIYEELPPEIKERLKIVYFIHPGLRSRLAFATLGRFFLSGGWVLLFYLGTTKLLTKSNSIKLENAILEYNLVLQVARSNLTQLLKESCIILKFLLRHGLNDYKCWLLMVIRFKHAICLLICDHSRIASRPGISVAMVLFSIQPFWSQKFSC